jgi:hypothetical protein
MALFIAAGEDCGAYGATIWVRNVLPHSQMFPNGFVVASPKCSRIPVILSINRYSHCAISDTFDRFPVRLTVLLSRPDLAQPGHGAQRRGWEERSHPEPRAAHLGASMARMASTGPSPKRAPWQAPTSWMDPAVHPIQNAVDPGSAPAAAFVPASPSGAAD